jgi:cell division protein FtsB
MKGTKFLLSFWLSTATFCLLQVLFGPGGLSETARLREQDTRLDTRLTALRDENARLTARYESLRTSAEAIRLEARALGYFRPGDTPVRTLDGAEFRLPPDAPDMASVPPFAGEGADSRWFFRIAMPLLFGLYYSLFHLIERLKPSKTTLPALRPGPRLNLPAPFSTGLDFFRK